MRLTVENLLKSEPFKDSFLAAGEKGLDKNVRAINVIDAPDGYKYIKPGTLAITSGYKWLEDSKEQEALIKNLAKSGASALGIKTRFFDGILPDNMKKIADELSFPVLFLSDLLAYSDIIDFFLHNIYIESNHTFERLEEVQKQFLDLIEHRSVDWIAKKLFDYSGKEVYAKYGDKVSHYNKQTDIDKVLANQEKWHKEKIAFTEIHDKSQVYLYSLELDGEITSWMGYEGHSNDGTGNVFWIINDNSPFSRSDLYLFNYALQATRTEIKKHAVEYIETQEEIIKQLLADACANKEECSSLLKRIGKVIPNRASILLLNTNINNKHFEKMIMQMIKCTNDKDYFKHMISGNYQDNFLILLPDIANEDLDPEKMITALGEVIAQTEELRAGLGSVHELSDLRYSHTEAEEALFWSTHQSTLKLYHYDELDMLKIIDHRLVKGINIFTDPYLGQIKEYDNKHGTVLLETLSIYTKNLWNYSTTGAELFIHPNTVKYRLQQIEELTGFDLNDSELRLNLEVALKLNVFQSGE